MKKMISLRVDEEVIDKLKSKADKLNIGYQTYINCLLISHINNETPFQFNKRLVVASLKHPKKDY